MRSPLELRLGHHSLGLHAGKLPSTIDFVRRKVTCFRAFQNSISHRSAALEALYLQSFEFKLVSVKRSAATNSPQSSKCRLLTPSCGRTLCHIRHELSSDMQKDYCKMPSRTSNCFDRSSRWPLIHSSSPACTAVSTWITSATPEWTQPPPQPTFISLSGPFCNSSFRWASSK